MGKLKQTSNQRKKIAKASCLSLIAFAVGIISFVISLLSVLALFAPGAEYGAYSGFFNLLFPVGFFVGAFIGAAAVVLGINGWVNIEKGEKNARILTGYSVSAMAAGGLSILILLLFLGVIGSYL